LTAIHVIKMSRRLRSQKEEIEDPMQVAFKKIKSLDDDDSDCSNSPFFTKAFISEEIGK